jgi:beta-lactamase regulating signal transducer with metallopeptidase domain
MTAAEVLRSVFWFNPLLWAASARLRQESEYACDDAVLDGARGRRRLWGPREPVSDLDVSARG